MKKFFYIFIACVFISGCDSKPDAPFGFEWGQSVQDVSKLNIDGLKINDHKMMVFATANTAPKPAQYDGKYHLTFTPMYGLKGVSFSTAVDENSWFFNQGRRVYDDISSQLEEKYGPPKQIVEKVERDGAQFYSCLKEEGCGKWERTYEYRGMIVTLSVNPSPGKLVDSLAKAYVGVDYEYYTDEMKKKEAEKYMNKKNTNNF